jgi:hypothetical protein
MTENDAMASFSVILGRGPNGTQESQSFSHFNENELYNKKQVSKKIETGAPLASVGILIKEIVPRGLKTRRPSVVVESWRESQTHLL